MSGARSVTALVPMRAKSERVPNKNIRPLAGRPLFEWIIETLLASSCVESVVVNTDSEVIARGVERLGGRVLWRPPELRGASIDMRPLIAYDLTQVEGDVFLQTHGTNPLLRPATVDLAVTAYRSAVAEDCLMSVTRHQSRFYSAQGRPINHDPMQLERTQDLEPVLEENSCLYVFSRDVFERHGHRVGAHPLLFEIDPLEAVDIDEEHDFQLAEALMRRRLNETRSDDE